MLEFLLIKLQPFRPEDTPAQVFPVDIAKFLRTASFIKHFW